MTILCPSPIITNHVKATKPCDRGNDDGKHVQLEVPIILQPTTNLVGRHSQILTQFDAICSRSINHRIDTNMSLATSQLPPTSQSSSTTRVSDGNKNGDSQDNSASKQAQDEEDEAKLIEALRQLDDMHNKVD